MKKLVALTASFLLAVPVLAETRSFTVNVEGEGVPVVLDLLTVRNAIGADFPFDWADLRVSVDGQEIPHQIDDADLNGRISAGDQLAFVASGTATVTASDTALDAVSYDPALEVSEAGDATLISSLAGNGFTVEISPDGLARITGFGEVQETLAAELGILRFSGYPESTWWANEQYGPHEEYTTLEEGGARHVLTQVLPAGPVRVAVVSEYASDRFVGLGQRVVTSVFAGGDVDVQSTVSFGGYSDMMKLQHMATNVLSQADPEAQHVLPVFRRLLWADQLGISAQDYFAERGAVTDGIVSFNSNDNLSPLYWGAAYIFASAEAWRAAYSDALGIAVIEAAHSEPEVVSDYDEWLSGNTWVFESQEFRTGVFKWSADEFAAYDASNGITLNEPNHYLPGTTVEFHYLYSVRDAESVADTAGQAAALAAGLASVSLE